MEPISNEIKVTKRSNKGPSGTAILMADAPTGQYATFIIEGDSARWFKFHSEIKKAELEFERLSKAVLESQKAK